MTKQSLTRRNCLFCGAPFWAPLGQLTPACSNPRCQHALASQRAFLGGGALCSLCGRPLPVSCRTDVCEDDRCQQRWRAQKGEAWLREKQEAEDAAFRSLERAVRNRLAEQWSDNTPCVVLHCVVSALVPTLESSRWFYRGYLCQLVEQGWDEAGVSPAGKTPSDPDESSLEAITAATCSACGGKCCLGGLPEAFAKQHDLVDFRRSHPQALASEFVETRFKHIAELTYPKSCVHHAASGCTLPRELRSRKCREFLCKGLKEVRELRRNRGEGTKVLVARAVDTRITSFALVSDQGWESVAMPPSEA